MSRVRLQFQLNAAKRNGDSTVIVEREDLERCLLGFRDMDEKLSKCFDMMSDAQKEMFTELVLGKQREDN